MQLEKFIKESWLWKDSTDTFNSLVSYFFAISTFKERMELDNLILRDIGVTKIMNEFDLYASKRIFELRDYVKLKENETHILRVLVFYVGTQNQNIRKNDMNLKPSFDMALNELSRC